MPWAVTPLAKVFDVDGAVAEPQTQVTSLFASTYGVRYSFMPVIAEFALRPYVISMAPPFTIFTPDTYLPLITVLAIVISPAVGVAAIAVGIVP